MISKKKKIVSVLLLVLLLALIIGCAVKNKESYQAPKRIINYNNHVLYDYGPSSPIVDSTWKMGAPFQPFQPIQFGLYESSFGPKHPIQDFW
jgi:hypothetical protein